MKDNFKLCYIKGNKAYFTDAPLKYQWGDDWNDKPYEHNAGEPYDSYTDDKGIKHNCTIKTLYFELNNCWYNLPCGPYTNSPYSVEDINKKAIAWIHTSKFNILAGTSMIDFIVTIKDNDGDIYLLDESNMGG